MINIKEFRVDKLVLLITLCRKKEYAQYLRNPQFSEILRASEKFTNKSNIYRTLIEDQDLMNKLSPIFESDVFKKLYEETLIYRDEVASKWEKLEPIIKDYYTNTLGIEDEKEVLVNIVHPKCITGTNNMKNEIFWGHKDGIEDFSYDVTYIMHEAMHCKYPWENGMSDNQYGVCHTLIELAIDNELRSRLGGNNNNYTQGHSKKIREKLMPLWYTFLSQKDGTLLHDIQENEEFQKYMKLAQSNNVQSMNFSELMKYCMEHYIEYGLDENTFKETELVKVEDLSKKQKLKSQCRFIDDALDTDIYALLDKDDAKTVFTLRRIGDYTQPISTIRQLDFETKSEAQGRGYATIGFEEMMKAILERQDISEVYIDAANPISGKIAEKFGLESTELGRYVIQNPNFDINYETVCQMIKDGIPEEQIRVFSDENGLSSAQIDTWLNIQKDLPQIDTQSYEAPIFTPPTENDLDNDSVTENTSNGDFIINEFGEIERPQSRLEELADQKKELESILRERQAELETKQANISPHQRRDAYEQTEE